MGRKRKDDEEKVRILAWRQENIIIKKFADIPNKTSKHTDDVRRQELRRNSHLSASGSSRECLHQMFRTPPEERPEDTK